MKTIKIALLALMLLLSSYAARAESPSTGISLLFLDVPHPLSLELDHRFSPQWGAGLGGGYIPPIGSSTGLQIGISNVEGRVRWHPWGGDFFLGLIGGNQIVTGKDKETIDTGGTSVPTTINLIVRGPYVTPHFGWFHVAQSGFHIGFELGFQIPIHSSSTLAVSVDDPSLASLSAAVQQTRAYQTLQADIESAANRIGLKVLPYTALLRIGWFF